MTYENTADVLAYGLKTDPTKHCKTRHFKKTLGSKMSVSISVSWGRFPIRRDVLLGLVPQVPVQASGK